MTVFSLLFVGMLNMLAVASLLVMLLSVTILYFTRWKAYEKVVLLAEEQALRIVSLEKNRPEASAATSGRREKTPAVSIVVTSEGEGALIKRNLESLLNQRLADFEVVVANASSEEDETFIVVSELQKKYPHLRQTFVPKVHRNIDQHKLALTLGIRSAKAPWVVVMLPDDVPESRDWLYHLSTHFTNDKDVVFGYSNYDNSIGSPGRRAVFQNGKRFLQQAQAALEGKAVGCGGTNVAFRREWFLQSGGFVDSLEVPYGECALLVDARAQEGRVAVELHPDAVTRRTLPNASVLTELYNVADDIFSRLQGRVRGVFVNDAVAGVAIYVAWLSVVLFVCARWLFFGTVECAFLTAWGVDLPQETPHYEWAYLALDLPALLLGVVLLLAPIWAAKRWCTALNERNFGIYVWWFELLQPWRNSH